MLRILSWEWSGVRFPASPSFFSPSLSYLARSGVFFALLWGGQGSAEAELRLQHFWNIKMLGDNLAFTHNNLVFICLSHSVHCRGFIMCLSCCVVTKRATAFVHSVSARSLRHATTDLDGSKESRDMFNVSAHPRFQGSLVLPQHKIIQKTAS